MGRDKASLAVGGRPMGRRVADALVGAGLDPVFAVGGRGVEGLELVADPVPPGGGPMAGVRAALARAGSAGAAIVVVLACDLPDVAPAGIRAVVQALTGAPGALAAVPVVAGRLEPLHAAWRVEALGAVPAGEPAVGRVLAALPHVEVAGLDPAWLRNVNAPGDLAPGR
jgi:molybdopterin-guanine dinucleotide biosynthesis protein A